MLSFLTDIAFYYSNSIQPAITFARIFKYDFVKTLQHKVAYKIMMNVELRRREVINKPLLLLLLLLLLLHTVKIDPARLN